MINYDELQKTIDSHIAANKAFMESIQQLPDGRIHIPCAPPALDIARVRELIGQQTGESADFSASAVLTPEYKAEQGRRNAEIRQSVDRINDTLRPPDDRVYTRIEPTTDTPGSILDEFTQVAADAQTKPFWAETIIMNEGWMVSVPLGYKQEEEKPVDIKQYTDTELMCFGSLSGNGKFGRIQTDGPSAFDPLAAREYRDMTDQEFERYKAAIQRRDGFDIMAETRRMLK
jgi:hypothetical protein